MDNSNDFFNFFLKACHNCIIYDMYKKGNYLKSISLLINSIKNKGEAKYGKESAEKLRTMVSRNEFSKLCKH